MNSENLRIDPVSNDEVGLICKFNIAVEALENIRDQGTTEEWEENVTPDGTSRYLVTIRSMAAVVANEALKELGYAI